MGGGYSDWSPAVQESVNTHDPVNKPIGYTQLDVQCIDVIEGLNLPHHLACVLKYLWRYQHKSGLEDLQKAEWYLRRYISIMEEKDAKP
jgi:hypothetical protein